VKKSFEFVDRTSGAINRQTSGESASLPQSLGCTTEFDMRLHFTFLRRKTISLQSNIAPRISSKMVTFDAECIYFALKNIGL